MPEAFAYRLHGPPGRTQPHAEHVSMDREWQLGGHPKPFDELLGAVDRYRRLPLGQEHEISVGMFTPQGPQQPQLVTLQAMVAGRPVLGATDMDGRHVEFDLLPAKAHQLAN